MINKTSEIKRFRKHIMRNKTSDPNLVDIGILSELASIGAGHAATSLSQILQQEVKIGVPRIHNVPAYSLLKIFGLHEMPTTALYIRLAEGPECDILLMLESDEARKVAAMMTMTSVQELDPSLESSAIEELANILVGSFLSSISNFLGVQLLTAPPERILDAFDSILDTILAKNSMVYDQTLIFDVSFTAAGKASKCILLLFPSPELQRLLLQQSMVMLEVGTPQTVTAKQPKCH